MKFSSFNLFKNSPQKLAGREMLLQFRDSMEAVLESSPPLPDSDEVVAKRLSSISEQAKHLLMEAPFESWNTAYKVEKLLAHIRAPESLEYELDTQIKSLEKVDSAARELHQSSLEKLREEFQADKEHRPKASADWNDPYTLRLRSLLERVLNDVHWKFAQRFLNRKILLRFTTTIFSLALVLTGFFVLVLIWAASHGEILNGFSGLGIATTAGLLGASFSILTGPAIDYEKMTIEEMLRQAGIPFVLLRVGVGGIAAVILYFFFESGVLGGDLLPALDRIGFTSVVPSSVDVDRLTSLIEASVASSPEELQAALSNDELQKKLANALVTNAEIANGSEGRSEFGQRLGDLVPNADLSKLLVWSFAAGFFEKLVAGVLGRVRTQAENG